MITVLGGLWRFIGKWVWLLLDGPVMDWYICSWSLRLNLVLLRILKRKGGSGPAYLLSECLLALTNILKLLSWMLEGSVQLISLRARVFGEALCWTLRALGSFFSPPTSGRGIKILRRGCSLRVLRECWRWPYGVVRFSPWCGGRILSITGGLQP